MMTLDVAVAATLQRLRAALGEPPAGSVTTSTPDMAATPPRMAIVLGSGWGPVSERLALTTVLPYRDLPAFPVLDVEGHAGELRLGKLAGVPVWLVCGRQHTYEHGDAAAMKGALTSLAAAGVELLILTNAAGSLVSEWRPGELMLLRDHLNLPQRSPLIGERGASRFVDLRDAYDPVAAAIARRVAAEQALTLHEGVYAWTLGPQFETPAEIRMMALLGAQAVGMSTVPETLVARHLGVRVLALSMFTNLAAGLDDGDLSHAQTLAAAQAAAPGAARFVEGLVAALAGSLA